MKFDRRMVISLQKLIIDNSGGRAGVRDFGLLDSALEAAYQTFDGEELYPSIEEKAARIGYCLVTNHAFIDGNKRIGLLVMISYLAINGINLKYSNDELLNMGLKLASGKIKYKNLLEWVKEHKNYVVMNVGKEHEYWRENEKI